MKGEFDPDSLPDLLPVYYKRLFPYGPYYKWLNYGGVPKTNFTHREFSFTLKDDVYIRYLSFGDQSELEKELQKRCPYKIDLGAVFSHRPKDHRTLAVGVFQAREKELVFDIDMTDYDDVRSCCSGADICLMCWPLMTIAIRIVDRALREDFGFRHLLWVYSGRRGVHCWVGDEASRKLSQGARTAIAEYLSIVKGGENSLKKVSLHHPFHPSIRKAVEICRQYFDDYACEKQDFLGDNDKLNRVMSLIPESSCDNSSIHDTIRKDIETLSNNSFDSWRIIKKRLKDYAAKGETLQQCADEIILHYCYPRLDINVSKGINHLLKSPFSVHPKTGRVCVPMDLETLDDFDPFAVPTISELCVELNAREEADSAGARDYRHTSISASVAVFEAFVKDMEATWRGKLILQSDAAGDF